MATIDKQPQQELDLLEAKADIFDTATLAIEAQDIADLINEAYEKSDEFGAGYESGIVIGWKRAYALAKIQLAESRRIWEEYQDSKGE